MSQTKQTGVCQEVFISAIFQLEPAVETHPSFQYSAIGLEKSLSLINVLLLLLTLVFSQMALIYIYSI